MKLPGLKLLAVVLVLLCFSTVLAQDNTCTEVVQQAINLVGDTCGSTGRNQACYGNFSLEATARSGIEDFTFQQAGDVVNIADVETIRLQQLDPAESTWGIALLKLQANLPDTMPGQNVTVLLFGDVEVQNAVEAGPQLVTMEAVSTGNINVRSGPSTNYGVIGSLSNGETMIANGRNADASWLRIVIPGSNSLGWVFSDLLTPTGDASELLEVDPADAEVPFTPMQAFYFRSGTGGSDCAEAPGNGILIQTPEGVGEINVRVNDVDIQLGSTAFLQAQPDDEMTISVVEGQGKVTAEGTTVVVPAGAQVAVPVDENLNAAGTPGEVQPYDPNDVQSLPVQLLPEAIAIAEPVSEDILANAAQPVQPVGANLGLPGVNMSGLSGMELGYFCSLMDQSFAQAGMTRDEYLVMLGQIKVYAPADSVADIEVFEQMLRSCP